MQQDAILFEDVTEKAGMGRSMAGMMGHGAAWGDFDGDGLADLYAGGFCDRPDSEYSPAKGPVPARLFHNLGNGKFEIVQNTPASFCGRMSGALFVDLNRDNFPELYVSNNSKGIAKRSTEPQRSAQIMKSKLFHNQKKTLTEITGESGVSSSGLETARNVGAFDYNSDGLLDLFVVEDKFKKGGPPRSILLKNKGNLKFEVANDEAGVPNDIYGLGLAVSDLNEDGRSDFFVAHSNRLFLSQGSNRYREAIELKTVFQWNPSDNEDWPCGAAFGDLNLDGSLDLVLTIHHEPARNKVYLNQGLKNGIPMFKDVTNEVGWNVPVPVKTPHVEIQDFNNDGFPDIYTTAAWKDGNTFVPLIYRNTGISSNGLPHFLPLRVIKQPMFYFPAGPTADYNQDGRLDIFLVGWFSDVSSRLLKNQTKGGNWLQVRGPIGSKIKLFSNNKMVGYQQLYIGNGYASGHLPICHFGLGKLTVVDLKMWLPNGTIKEMKKVSVNKMLEIL